MRRKMLLAVVVLLCAASMAWPQTAGGKVSVAYYPGLPHPHVIVTNNYSSPVTALMIVTTETSPSGKPGTATAILDTGVNWPHDRPIEPGKTAWLPVGHWLGEDPSTLHPQLAAAVFEDGSSFGDPTWAATIRSRWKAAYDEIGKVETLLVQGRSQRLALSAVVQSLNGPGVVPQIQPNTKGVQLLQSAHVVRAARMVVDRALINLQRAPVDGVVGDPQRIIPVILTRLSEWRGVLEPLLTPSQLSAQ